ncbi:L-ribulose-5-phosphate 4-epimerase [Edwardsiella tarda]|uniref:L-ribulose-5-phosphate 4-epimerase n=1 Tax=Edwardsiella tarda TaxID=636 RepID=UPI00063BE48D|nr:L-ribulose-5-phosphate 4-epimerase [Edwardsiella tarda]AKH89421.1 L-ribulose-5-phosphate 4-epimerase [Edwardsiella tarda]
MSLRALREAVLEANLALPRHHLVTFTWGNVSGIDRQREWMVIKPSGISYTQLRAEDLVVLDLDGQLIEGKLRPSSDSATHLALYRHYPELGGIVHTHSTHATAWAQARRAIPLLGTTQADYFNGAVPCSRLLTEQEVTTDYEAQTGQVIIETLDKTPILTLPGILVAQHGPFSWGRDTREAIHNAVVLEEVARMAWMTLQLAPGAAELPEYIRHKHYQRKHGKHAYYGQAHA